MTEKSAIRIMALDDEPLMLKLLSRVLANLGFAPIKTCDNGRAALQWMDDESPDLILLDLNMPEMDGVEFVRHLVEHGYEGALILVSGEDERMQQAVEKLVRAHKITVLGHLHKPVAPEVLKAMIDKWSPPQRKPRVEQKIYGADELRAAIANGELVNYYQPKVAVASGRVVGVEALVRWQHPQDGMVLPGQFIGVAEAHGLIDELNRAVLIDALQQASAWQEAGMVLQMAINVSMDNLASLDFADFLTGQAAATGVPPQQVVLEVAEGRIMTNNMREQLETLARLRLKRFRLSIDDFGTGHSSLVQLRDVPFDELKIDRSFVHRAASDEAIRSKYDASLSIARRLNMENVAEGVEERDDWNLLRRTGCDLAQGYFIARPMPATSVPGWMQSWQARK